ncbi:hypothetical protein E5676_scaffold392G00680 [Cucumis melo var. makuwa]|uniref:Reverse transcriptase domain-containing protein n=1 Tax=Cucumis melo var. makuwa TaxID=1194695 RepID=A0A5D3DC03_CUCMM|nr:hypothetical protein E6C27_scaffold238G001510 [Cucumis melo var. makuwa]TYK21102.1 hypothetical protein E5676_scaffold392G00680 [Cucumis melo var. makuwa]
MVGETKFTDLGAENGILRSHPPFNSDFNKAVHKLLKDVKTVQLPTQWSRLPPICRNHSSSPTPVRWLENVVEGFYDYFYEVSKVISNCLKNTSTPEIKGKNVALTATFTEAETFKALKALGKNKATGPNRKFYLSNTKEEECGPCKELQTNQPHDVNLQGRQILDQILIANEIVEEYQTKRKKGWILKLLTLKRPSIKDCEVSGALLNKLVVDGHYEGLVVGKERVHIPILQFADDTLLFYKYDESMLMKLKDTIALFEWCSGPRINWEKSALCGVNLEEDELKLMAEKMGCSAENMPFVYLGLPLGGIQAVNVASSLERMRNCFWEEHTGSKINHLVKWAKVIQPQPDGGLGLGALQNKNMALLATWG